MEKQKLIIVGDSKSVSKEIIEKLSNDYDAEIREDAVVVGDVEKLILMPPSSNTYILKPQPILEYPVIYDPEYEMLSKKDKNAVIVPVRTEAKIDRNSPCPCGSGKNIKNVVLNKYIMVKNIYNRIFNRWSKWTLIKSNASYTKYISNPILGIHNEYSVIVDVFEKENYYTGLKKYKHVEK